MAKGNNKQRARKKHQKEKKRKAKLDLAPKKRVDAVALAARAHLARGLAEWSPEAQGVTGLARLRDIGLPQAAALAEEAQRTGHPGATHVWTPMRIAAAADDAILARLASLGIPTDRAGYLAATADDFSASPHAAAPWTSALAPDAPAGDVDFTLLTAWDLWRRWRPERTSREQLLLAYHRAYYADMGGRLEDAIEGYLGFGSMLWKAFPDAKDPAVIDEALDEPGWRFETFHQHLGALGQIVAEEGDDVNAHRFADFLGEVGHRLTQADPDMLAKSADYRAEILLEAGFRDEATPLLRDALARRPDRALAYALLARSIAGPETSTTAQLQEALAIVQKGAEKATDAADWDLDELVALIEERVQERLAAGT